MTVGVIITVFNLEVYVAEAIESVLNQSRKADKILVINDGSSDGSAAVISRFANQIEIIDNVTNMGVLPSMISGIKLLNTDIIAFLDGDDRWDINKIKSIIDIYQSDESCMLVTHSYRRMNANGQIDAVLDKTLLNLERIEGLRASIPELDQELKNSILSYKGVWLGSAFSIRRKYLNVNEFESWSLGIWGHELSHQDQPLAAFMILQNPTGIIRYISNQLFDYRIFGDNSSGASSDINKALRTINRSKATLLRTYHAVKLMQGRERELGAQLNKLREIEYLQLLYTGKKLSALKIFFTLFFSFWNLRESIKEIVRFCGVLFFGVGWVLKHK